MWEIRLCWSKRCLLLEKFWTSEIFSKSKSSFLEIRWVSRGNSFVWYYWLFIIELFNNVTFWRMPSLFLWQLLRLLIRRKCRKIKFKCWGEIVDNDVNKSWDRNKIWATIVAEVMMTIVPGVRKNVLMKANTNRHGCEEKEIYAPISKQ